MSNTGTGSTKEVTFTGDFSTINCTAEAGVTYQVYITDVEL